MGLVPQQYALSTPHYVLTGLYNRYILVVLGTVIGTKFLVNSVLYTSIL